MAILIYIINNLQLSLLHILSSTYNPSTNHTTPQYLIVIFTGIFW